MVIFYLQDVWTLGSGGWNQLSAPATPGGRTGPASFYDPVRDRLLLFGGSIVVSGNTQYLNDVWVRSKSASDDWVRLFPTGTPPSARSGATFVYDPGRDRAVLFGGANNSSLNDVWVLNLAQGPDWVQLQPAGLPPSVRSRHSAIYDGERDRMIIFGGGPFGSNDTWELGFTDPPQWNELHPTGSLPFFRLGQSAVLDAAHDRMIVFGGGHVGEPEPFYNDVWELSLAGTPAWNQMSPSGTPPSGRTDASAFFDASRQRMVIHAGGRLIGSFPSTENDTWELQLSGSPAWNELFPAGPLPPSRGRHAWGYDSLHDALILFGGYGSGDNPNDTWILRWPATTGVVGTPLPHITVHASPNPVLSRTTFQFETKQEGPVDLWIHDIQGRHIATVLDHRVLPAGTQQVRWQVDVVLRTGGLYFYRLRTLEGEAGGRLVFLK
jgi:hypothetical protein